MTNISKRKSIAIMLLCFLLIISIKLAFGLTVSDINAAALQTASALTATSSTVTNFARVYEPFDVDITTITPSGISATPALTGSAARNVFGQGTFENGSYFGYGASFGSESGVEPAFNAANLSMNYHYALMRFSGHLNSWTEINNRIRAYWYPANTGQTFPNREWGEIVSVMGRPFDRPGTMSELIPTRYAGTDTQFVFDNPNGRLRQQIRNMNCDGISLQVSFDGTNFSFMYSNRWYCSYRGYLNTRSWCCCWYSDGYYLNYSWTYNFSDLHQLVFGQGASTSNLYNITFRIISNNDGRVNPVYTFAPIIIDTTINARPTQPGAISNSRILVNDGGRVSANETPLTVGAWTYIVIAATHRHGFNNGQSHNIWAGSLPHSLYQWCFTEYFMILGYVAHFDISLSYVSTIGQGRTFAGLYWGQLNSSERTPWTSTHPMPAQFMTFRLYARWNYTVFNVGFVANAPLGLINENWGSGGQWSTFTIRDTRTLPSLSWQGMEFLGWYDNPDFNGTRITNIPAGSLGNRRFYARWDILRLEVRFFIDGQVWRIEQIPYGSYLGDVLNTSIFNNLNFSDWYYLYCERYAKFNQIDVANFRVTENVDLFGNEPPPRANPLLIALAILAGLAILATLAFGLRKAFKRG